MKRLLCLIFLSVAVSGCATPPIIMENHVQRKVFTRCASDTFCFQSTYDVTWDSWCTDPNSRRLAAHGCRYGGYDFDYPVSSRSKETVLLTVADGYLVTLPAGGNIVMPQDTAKGVAHD
jgi:hypothetical protein